MSRFAPRIKRHRDGTCSLVGLTPQMLRAIFNSAALYEHEVNDRRKAERPARLAEIEAAPPMIQEMMRENLVMGDRWCKNQLIAIKVVCDVLSPVYEPGPPAIPVIQLNAAGRQRRLREVRARRDLRRRLFGMPETKNEGS